ncbi:MAG: magnesium chelatase, partial [Balneolaceae bacterium]
MAFSANPEDYTNRGNIITPLKDRIDSQILTHYPKELKIGEDITRQEAWQDRGNSIKIHIPELFRQVIEKAAFEARESEYVDQKSGVSTRMTITALEQVVSSAERRAILNGEKETTVRIADLYHMVPAITGKIELVYEGEQEGALSVAKHILGKAISKTFKIYFPDPNKKKEDQKSVYKTITDWFADGNEINISDTLSNKEYEKALKKVDGLEKLIKNHAENAPKTERYIWMDFALEALHQNSMLSKQDLDDQTLYSDMLGSMFSSLGDIGEEGFDEFE